MAIHFPVVPATFRNIPRVGSTSFKDWVFQSYTDYKIVLDHEKYSDTLPQYSLDEIKKMWPNYGTTFGFVRNPYDRLVSIFHFIGQSAKKNIIRRKLNPNFDEVIRNPINDDIKLLISYKKGFNHWISNLNYNIFDQMVSQREIKKEENDGYNYRSKKSLDINISQLFYFNNIVPDIVVKLENSEKDFVKIQELLECYKPLSHTNKSLHNNYKDYYNDASIKLSKKWLEKDLDTFKYVF